MIEANPFDVPGGIIERSLDRALEKARQESPGVDDEEFRAAYRPLVLRIRKREILLESVARQESIEVTEEELDQGLARLGPARRRSAGDPPAAGAGRGARPGAR
ncbi:MAG: hypothetical protein MZV65_29130 [Chromatiales bacterium]|nr:hypothetical protein [Chromatiales bacterium]